MSTKALRRRLERLEGTNNQRPGVPRIDQIIKIKRLRSRKRAAKLLIVGFEFRSLLGLFILILGCLQSAFMAGTHPTFNWQGAKLTRRPNER